MGEETLCNLCPEMREMLISLIVAQLPEIVRMLIRETKWASSAEERKSALELLMILLRHLENDMPEGA